MTALAQSYNQPLYEQAVQLKHNVIGASVTLYAGTLCMNDAGVAKVMTAAGLAGGAKAARLPDQHVYQQHGQQRDPAPAEIGDVSARLPDGRRCEVGRRAHDRQRRRQRVPEGQFHRRRHGRRH